MQEETGARIADVVRAYLLTARGVRILSPSGTRSKPLMTKAPDAVQSRHAACLGEVDVTSNPMVFLRLSEFEKRTSLKTVRYLLRPQGEIARLEIWMNSYQVKSVMSYAQAAERLT